MPFTLEQTIGSIASKMRIDFGISRQITHRELKGRAREIVMKRFLKNYLPPALGIESGEIVSSDGGVSKQMDIVIFDKLHCPIFIREDEVHIFPIESVYAVIEVKSQLGRPKLKDCVEKIKSVKELSKEAYVEQKGAIIHTTDLYGKKFGYFPTLGFVFAFDSIKIDLLKQKLDELNSEKNIGLEHRVDSICILDKGIITNRTRDGKINPTPEPGSKLGSIETENGLLLFYVLLMEVLNQTWMPPVRILEYIEKIEYSTISWSDDFMA